MLQFKTLFPVTPGMVSKAISKLTCPYPSSWPQNSPEALFHSLHRSPVCSVSRKPPQPQEHSRTEVLFLQFLFLLQLANFHLFYRGTAFSQDCPHTSLSGPLWRLCCYYLSVRLLPSRVSEGKDSFLVVSSQSSTMSDTCVIRGEQLFDEWIQQQERILRLSHLKLLIFDDF